MRNSTSFSVVVVIFSCMLLVGCQPPPLLSYPWYWDYTKTKPNEPDIVGKYKILKLRLPSKLEDSVRERDATITLQADHTAVLTDVPNFDDFGEKLVCRLSGSAHWELYDQTANLGGWSVLFQSYNPATKPTAKECELENSSWSILILSKHAPYRLYAIVGDPDSDTGVEYKWASLKFATFR
jgi:hypothetical protein